MPKTPYHRDPEVLQNECDNWNRLYPVGTEVIRTDDFGKTHLTKTRSQAQVLSGHTAVIWVEGYTGCYRLDRIQPRKCQVCGCTTFHGCIVEGGPGEDIIEGCHWVKDDLCSACV